MKLLLLISLAFSTVIPTNRGYIKVYTPKEIKRMKEMEEKKVKGEGVNFYVKVEKKESELRAWIRGCGDTLIGNLETEQNEDYKKKLEKLKNGDYIRLRMKKAGSCEVNDFSQ